MAEALRSALHDRHVAAGAKFAEFGGWLMPLEYAGGGVLAEHKAVREAVGIFDVSHLGKVTIVGAGAVEFLNSQLTNDLSRIAAGQAQYTMMCNALGGVVDDLIAYRINDDEVFCIPNASNAARVAQVLTEAAPPRIQVADRHPDFAILAVQGPASDETLAALGLPVGHGYMSFVNADFEGAPLTVCRTGYTGERGYEVVLASAAAPTLWDAVLRAGGPLGLRPAGLGARDTLRTEMGYALHGHELTPGISPVEAGLSWAVGWDKPEFPGADALRTQRAQRSGRRSTGLVAAGRGIPRPGMVVVDDEGEPIGEVTSGTFSPTLRRGIGLALVDRARQPGERVGVDIRGRVEPFELRRPPFVQSGVRAG